MEQREFIVDAEAAGQRIDRFLSGEDTGLSRSALQGLVAEGHVLCNGKSIAKSLKLKAGDTILLEIPDAKPIEAVPQDIPLDIVYEDDHLLVVNKPKGMVVHPAPGNPDGTLVNALLWHCKGSLSQWSVTSFGFGRNFAGFGKRLCAYSKKSLWCGRSSGREKCSIPVLMPCRWREHY